MDDTRDSSLALKAIGIVVLGVAFALPVKQHLGDTGVSVVLFATLAAVVLLVHAHSTSRSLLRLSSDGGAPTTPVEDVWRSERWVKDAVERGLRALEDWRHDQTG